MSENFDWDGELNFQKLGTLLKSYKRGVYLGVVERKG